MPSKRLFLGNLSFDLTSADLKQFISTLDLNPTDVIAIVNPDNGRCRGFGFAEFSSESRASEALPVLNGAELNGRPIRADFAVERNRGKPHRPSSSNGVPASDIKKDLRHANPPPGSEYRGNGKDRKPQNVKGRKPMKHRQRESTSHSDVWDDRRRR